jgi:hypothetical protein
MPITPIELPTESGHDFQVAVSDKIAELTADPAEIDEEQNFALIKALFYLTTGGT